MKSLKTFILFAFILISYSGFAQKTNSKISFRDSTDHAIDMSDWLLNKKGFLFVPTIITEPAVGYGGAAAASPRLCPQRTPQPQCHQLGTRRDKQH